jgi:hypothetical protein
VEGELANSLDPADVSAEARRAKEEGQCSEAESGRGIGTSGGNVPSFDGPVLNAILKEFLTFEISSSPICPIPKL